MYTVSVYINMYSVYILNFDLCSSMYIVKLFGYTCIYIYTKYVSVKNNCVHSRLFDIILLLSQIYVLWLCMYTTYLYTIYCHKLEYM